MLADIRAVVRRIPRGKVSSYGAVAAAAGYPGRARQVVWALRNAAPDLPWYRVVGAGGKILLTGEHAFEQRLRLEQERVTFDGGAVRMEAHEHRFKTTCVSPASARSGNRKSP